MTRKKSRIDVHKIIGNHPVTDCPIDLKWHRCADRYNNGATRYGHKYMFRYLIGYAKQNPYTEEEIAQHKARQNQ